MTETLPQPDSGQAERIITLCGGFDAVASITGRSANQVRKWTYPKARGGTGGLIPSQFHQLLLDAMRGADRPLRPDDFFDPSPKPDEDRAA